MNSLRTMGQKAHCRIADSGKRKTDFIPALLRFRLSAFLVLLLQLDEDVLHAFRAELLRDRFGRPERDEMTARHERETIAPLGFVHVVRGHEDRRSPVRELVDDLPEAPARCGI